MNLKSEIENFQKEMLSSMPQDALKIMLAETDKLVKTGLAQHALKVGDKAPLFVLENTAKKPVLLAELLQQGPIVLNFYRGAWCPYCNLELKAWDQYMPQLKKLGANLVSITPNLHEKSLALLAENPFAFDILCDQRNRVAETYGLVFQLADVLRPIYMDFGINLPEYDGNTDYKLPIPATYLVGSNGIIMQAFVHADYTQRMEPQDIITLLQTMKDKT